MSSSFRDLRVWQEAIDLAMEIYHGTASFPKQEIYGLAQQMRRAAVSIPSNIAEGHGRLDDGHFRQFLAISRGSLYELQTQLELTADLKYLDGARIHELIEQSYEVARMINGLLASIARDGSIPRQADSATR